LSIKHLYHQQQAEIVTRPECQCLGRAEAEKHQDADGWLEQVEAPQKLANHHEKLRQGKGSLVGWLGFAGSSQATST
jgi:hypothetical protein